MTKRILLVLIIVIALGGISLVSFQGIEAMASPRSAPTLPPEPVTIYLPIVMRDGKTITVTIMSDNCGSPEPVPGTSYFRNCIWYIEVDPSYLSQKEYGFYLYMIGTTGKFTQTFASCTALGEQFVEDCNNWNPFSDQAVETEVLQPQSPQISAHLNFPPPPLVIYEMISFTVEYTWGQRTQIAEWHK